MKKLRDPKKPSDAEAWLETIQDIDPLVQPEEKPQAPLIIGEIKPSLKEEGLYNPNSFEKIEVGNTDNLDANTAEKFRKGKYKIEARLDLHGYTEKQAFAAVKDFVLNSYIAQRRCVLIITGKGLKENDRPWYEAKGVIKEALPR